MQLNSADLKKLYDEKKYSEIIDIIENKVSDQDRNSGQLNLLGVCKLLNDTSKESLNSAKKDFRRAYLQEKNTQNGLLALKNFVNLSMDLFDKDFRLGNDTSKEVFDEIFLYFNERKEVFQKEESFIRTIIRVFKRYLDLDNVILYLKKIIEINDKDIGAICTYLYYNCYRRDWDQKKFFEFSQILNRNLPLYPSDELNNLSDSKNKKINLAFFSSDIRHRHAVTFFLKTVLMNYDKEKFDIFLYFNNKEDDTTKEFKDYIPRTKNMLGESDIDVINSIRNDKIDIMINLMGVSSEHRLELFKNRLAKKQVLWCGYNNTTGIDQMDYLISDKNSIYTDEKKFYSEEIIYLRDIWSCHSGFSKKREFNEAPVIKNKFITFGSFNNFRKINDEVINAWSKILKKVPNSKLVLTPSDSASLHLISEKFLKKGVLNSIKFQSYKKDFDVHLNQYNKIDFALDTFPYNGVTTSFESIWMGVPVLTIKGYNFISRAGESINKNLGLDELISENEDDYIEKAISISKDKNKILDLRKIVYDKALESPLFNKKKFCKEFFSSLEKIYN